MMPSPHLVTANGRNSVWCSSREMKILESYNLEIQGWLVVLNVHMCLVDIEPNSPLLEHGLNEWLTSSEQNRVAVPCVVLDCDSLFALTLGSLILGSFTLGESCHEDIQTTLWKDPFGIEPRPF